MAQVEKLMATTDEDFERAVGDMDMRSLLETICALQSAMAEEQQTFDRLSGRLEASEEPVEHRHLSAGLCHSQARLAKLCARNMRCFTQQASRKETTIVPPSSYCLSSPVQTDHRFSIASAKTLTTSSVLNNTTTVTTNTVSGSLSVDDILRGVRGLRKANNGPTTAASLVSSTTAMVTRGRSDGDSDITSSDEESSLHYQPTCHRLVQASHRMHNNNINNNDIKFDLKPSSSPTGDSADADEEYDSLDDGVDDHRRRAEMIPSPDYGSSSSGSSDDYYVVEAAIEGGANVEDFFVNGDLDSDNVDHDDYGSSPRSHVIIPGLGVIAEEDEDLSDEGESPTCRGDRPLSSLGTLSCPDFRQVALSTPLRHENNNRNHNHETKLVEENGNDYDIDTYRYWDHHGNNKAENKSIGTRDNDEDSSSLRYTSTWTTSLTPSISSPAILPSLKVEFENERNDSDDLTKDGSTKDGHATSTDSGAGSLTSGSGLSEDSLSSPSSSLLHRAERKKVRQKLPPDLFGGVILEEIPLPINGGDRLPSTLTDGRPKDEDMNQADDDTIPSIIGQFEKKDSCKLENVVRSLTTTDSQWDPNPLLRDLYRIRTPESFLTLKQQQNLNSAPSANYSNIEGYLEKLPSGRRKATFWNAWKRRYFRAKDGYLFYYQNHKAEQPNLCLQLMGGRVEAMDQTVLGIDDGKGHYVVVRCGSRTEAERWRRALLTHMAENYAMTYVHPVPCHPQFYEDVIVIDLGSSSVRAGILCTQATLPQIFFPTVCATDKETGDKIYGSQALDPRIRSRSTISFPLKPSPKVNKYAVDINTVEDLLDLVFKRLNINPSEYQVQLSLPRTFPVRLQMEVVKLLLERRRVRALNLTSQSVLALFAYNATSGVVVDVGERTDVVPIVDGYAIESGVSRIPYGGSRIVDHLRHFLHQKSFSLVTDVETFLIRFVLEQLCYCAENYKQELKRFTHDPYSFEESVGVQGFFRGDTGASWDRISLDCGRFQAPEGIFNPEAWGLDHPGLHKLVHKAIKECGVDVRKQMTKSIYLCGGVTMLPGFVERLTTELDRLTPPSLTPKVHASPYRYHASYLGACVLAASGAFGKAKITREEWHSKGSSSLRKWNF